MSSIEPDGNAEDRSAERKYLFQFYRFCKLMRKLHPDASVDFLTGKWEEWLAEFDIEAERRSNEQKNNPDQDA